MALLDKIALPLLLRQLNKSARQIDRRLEEQNLYLRRLADKFAPDQIGDPVDPRARSIDYSEDLQQGRILDYVERMQKDLGREPTEEELIQWLDGEAVSRPG